MTNEQKLEYFNQQMVEYGMEPMTHPGEISDWGVYNCENEAQLDELAHDLRSEMHSEMCKNKNAWRYEL